MKIPVAVISLVLLGACARCTPAPEPKPELEPKDEDSALDCVFEDNVTSCLRLRLARDLDLIETQVTGKRSETPISAVIEQAGHLVAEVVSGVDEDDTEETAEEAEGESRGLEEARRKKFGKKKKKHLQKLIGLAMLFKAKISLLLQLISTHLQVKFFVIALIGLVLNAARFWLDLKKTHQPSKVIYYEHAQHQHHYDHEEDYGSHWGRSSKDSPQQLAYNAYVPEQ